MDEKEFIYSKIKYLTESVDFLTEALEKQTAIIDSLVKVIDIIQSPDYAYKQSKMAQAKDIADKIQFIRNLKR